jgi:hypothetical protein
VKGVKHSCLGMLLRFIEYIGVGTVIPVRGVGDVVSIVGGELVSHPLPMQPLWLCYT